MRNSFEFKECERFLKRVLKDRGMFTKGAVIAFLITGGIGFLGGHTVEAAQAGVIGNPHSGGTTIDYHWAGTDLLTHESIVFAPVTDDNVGTTAERFQGIYNRQAFNSVIIGGHAWAAGSNLSRKYLDNPGTYRPAQQTVIGNNATGIGGQATAVGSGTFAMDQATAVGNDVMAIGASSIAIGNDDISEKYKDTMTDKIVKSIYGDGESTDVKKQGIFREVEFIDSTGTKRKRTSLDPSGYNTLRSWNWFKSSYMTDNSSSAGGEDTHIYSPTMSRGIGSIAIGSRSIAKSDGSTAIGTLAFALGEGSTAMGLRAYTGEEAPGAVAIGEESRSFAAQSLAVGNHNESSEQGAMSYGYSAKAAGIGSLAIGYHTYANTEFGTNAGAAALISGVQGVNAPLTSAQQTAWDNYVAKASAYYTEVENYPKDPDVQGSVVAAKTAMDTAYTQLTATGFSVPNVANLTYIADGQAGNKNKSTEVTNKIKALQTGAANIDTKKGTDIYLTTKNSDGTKNEVKKTVAKGANSIAIGYYSVATANSSIAQGAGTVAEGGSSIALGSLASTTDTATNSISIGVASSVKKENSIALGTQSSVYGAGSVALGAGSRVYNTNSMAMGYGSTVLAENSAAIGVGSKIDFGAGNSQAIGTNALINKNAGNSLAFGNGSNIGENSVNTVAQGFRSTIGTGAYNSMALGAYASVGDNAKASFAMGTASRVDAAARSSMALGEGSYVNKDQSIALGRNARAEFANSVALGFQSTTHYYGNPSTREASLSNSETATNVHGLKVGAYLPQGSKLADKLAKLDATAAGYVSVGGWTEEVSTTENGVTKKENVLGLRRIVNVAPGALDTDAVTVAQLRDWTDKTAHFLSISGASGKSSTNFVAESWAIDGKDRNNNTIGTLTIKGNFENEGASTVDRGLAVGAYANALGNRSVAIADHAVAKGNQAIAMGQNSFILGENSTAVGSYATAFADNAIAMGVDSTIGEVTRDLTGDEKTNPSYKRITAVGRSNQSSIAIGFGTNVNADRAIALGVNASVVPVKATGAKGATTYTEAHSSIAIGQNATVTGAQHSIALGENSEVIASDVATPTTAAFTGETNTDPGNGVLSVGSTNNNKNITRRIIHVSGGSDDYDAVNVKQLKKATAYYSVNSNESADKAVNGIASVKSNINNDGAIGRYSVAIGSYANANKESGVALGREVVTQGEKGVGLGYAVVSRGDEAVAIGSVARAYGANSIALGKSAQVGTTTTESDGTVTYGEVKHAIAIGNGAKVEAGQGSIALGWASKVTEDDVANSTATGATKVSPYLLTTGTAAEIAYDYSNDKGNGVVSFGTRRNSTDAMTTFARRLTGVAGGINDYDAVNVKQLKALETNERHIKAQTGNNAYTPDASGNVTLNYVNGRGEDVSDTTVIKDVAKKSDEWKLAVQSGKATTGTAVVPKGSTTKQVTLKEGSNITLATDTATGTVTISAAGGIKSVTSGNTNALTVSTTSGAVTVTPVLAGAVSTAADANKLVTAGVVNTAIAPLATKSLNNITDDGKKVITGLGPVVAASGSNVTVAETTADNATGRKKYTVSVTKDAFENGTNTTLSGDGSATNKYKFSVNAALTGMTSVTAGNSTTGLTLSSGGAGTAADPKTDVVISKTGVTFKNANGTSTGTVSIGNAGINAGNLVISNVKAPTANTDAANKKYVDDNLMNVDVITKNGTADKTENVTNGTSRKMTLKAGDNVELTHNNGTVTITAKGGLKTVTSANDAIAATTDANGNVTLTANVGTTIDGTAANAGKLATVGAVNTAITPLANKTLDNITDDGKKVITGLGPVVAASGSNVTVAESTIDNETGTKKYTVSVTKDVFASGTNTTKAGTGTAADPYKYNLNEALTDMASIAGKGGTNTLTIKNGAAVMTFNDATTGKNAKAANITVNNINITGLKDAALTATSTDAVTGKQLKSVIDDVAKKSSSDYRLVVNPETGTGGTYTADKDGNINLKVVDKSNTDANTNTTTVTIKNVAKKDELDKLKEAKTIIFVDANGDEVFKQANGTFKKADGSAASGTVVTKVNTTTATPITNVKSVVADTTVTGANTDYLDKLNQAVDNSNTSAGKNKTTAANVSDLQQTADAIVKRGLTFQGNDGNNIKKALGETLNVVGEGTYTTAPTTAAGNIYTKQVVNGNNKKLEIGLASDLKNISSVSSKENAGKSTKVALGDDGLTVTNKQGAATTDTTTITIGKDGINAGSKDVKNVNEVDAKTVKADTVTVGKVNSSGTANDGVDGKVTVTGKNGSAVELNGATGGLTLTTVNGTATNTVSIKTKEGSGPIIGEGGAAAPTNMSRLVYTTTVNGADTEYEVATMKDGMKYAGDDVTATDKSKVIAKKLNETVDIVGGATTTNLTTNNIGVVNDNGKLNVRLSKVVTGMTSITAGKTVLNTSSVTVSGAGTNTNKTILDATGTTVTDGATNGKTTTTTVDGLKVVNNTKGAQIGADLIRVNGTKGAGEAVTGGIAIGNQTVTATKNDATTAANTGNYITGLNNKDWDLDTKGYVSGRAATEDQLKVLSDKISAKSASDYRLIANPDDTSGEYTLTANGSIELKVQDASNTTSVNTIKINNVAKKDELDKLKEAKTIIFVDADGEEVFKQTDGTFKKANKQPAHGDVVTKVNTTDATPITNVKSIVENTTATGTNPDYIDKLNATVADATNGTKNKTTAVNVSDLQKTAAAIIDRGITFQGNDGKDIKKGLGQTLNIVGEGNYGTPAAAPNTAAGNIFTKENGGNLEIGLAKDLQNISSITNTKPDGSKSTKLELGDDELKVINTQGTGATATTTKVTIGKDGINADGKNVTNVNEVDATSVKANTVTVGKENPTGTTTGGVDGTVTVTGANGSGVEIKGADGSITVYGANGSNKASFKTKEVEGVLGADVKVGDTKPNMTRFVYETANPDGSATPITHVVATMDDGMKYSGDDHEASTATAAEKHVVTRKLNERLEIVGGAKTNLTNNNIGVINNGDTGKLTVKLSKNLKEIETIANVADSTDTTKPSTVMTLSNDGVTFKNTQAPTTAGGKATTSTVEIKKDGVTEFKTNDGTNDGNTVTINGKTGTIATGNTVVNPTSVTVSGTGTAKTTLDASGTTVTDGKANGKSVVTTVNGSTITDGTKTLVTTATGITISPSAVTGKTVSLTNAGLNNGGNRITDVADPTANTDAANKQYVDARTKLRYKANTVTPDVPGVAKANHEINLLDGVLNIEGVTDEVVTTASKDGKITVGLAPKVIKKLDQLAATTSDGRDSKLGSEANAIASTGIATADGINGQNVTYKVNALRHGEAGSVVFTDEDGNRLVKATDGKYYKATDVNADGTVKATPAGGTAPVGLDLLGADKDKAYSSLVSPDGKTTDATSVLNNVGSVLTRVLPTLDTNTDKTKFLDKLDKATEAGSKVAHAAVNVTDLKNTSDAIIAKGIGFKGNTGTVIHKNLGETLNIVGEGTAPTTTAANNIATKRNANGDLEIGLAKDLQGITLVSNTNDTTKPNSKMELTDDGVTLTNTQPVAGGTAETSKATIGKDGKTTFENSTAPNNSVEIDSKEGTITVGKDTDKQVVVNGKDGKITTGKTEVNGAEVIVKDSKNFTKINTGGTTITNGTNTTIVGPNGITIKPSVADSTKSVTLTDAGLNNGGNVISNVANPINDTDAANKQYVDARTKLRYKADTTVDDAGAAVTDHTINLLDGTLEITGTADKVVTKATKDGKINIDLADAVKKKLDQLDAKNSDGRDGKTGNETGAIAKDGLTKADGLNEKTTTYKVNALRHGEAGSVVYTDDEGHRLVKAVDGKYHRAEAVNADGTLKAAADLPLGVTLDVVDNPQARVVNSDGTTTSQTVFGNVASPIAKLTAQDDAGADLDDQSYLNKLTTASKTNASKFAAVNATDLYTTSKEILAKGMNFVGNDTTVNVHRDLGATLKVQGTENHTRPAGETANTTNILVKANADANGDGLNISLAKDLQGITSITNTNGTTGATGTKLEIGNDGLTVTNTQAGTPATISTMTVGKDGKTTFTNSENPNNAIEINSKEGTITAGTADDKKVTINGKDGKITTGHTEVNGTSVSVTDDHNNKTETTATGTTVTDGSNNKTVTAATGVTVTDGTNTASYTATTSKLSDGANKSVETTANGTTITNGNVTTTATAGNTEYKDGNNVTTVNTNGMTVKDGTSTATHTAGSTMFEDADKSAIYSSSGSTIVDGTGSAVHTAGGSTFTEGNNTAIHTATGSTYSDGTNTFHIDSSGISIRSDNGGNVSLTPSGLDNGGNIISHVGDGVADTDAVNVKQLKANKVSLTVNDNNAATTNHNLVLTTSTDATDKHTKYDVKLADKVTLGKDDKAVTVDGTNGTIKAGKDANVVTVDGTKASITAGKDDKAVTVDGTKASITAGKDDKAVTVDGTKASITAGKDDKAVTVDGTKASITAGKDDKAVTVDGTKASITAGKDGNAVTVDGTKASITAGKDGNAVTVDGTKASITAGTGANAITADGTNATLVVGGTGATTDSANKVTINGTDGIIKTGNTKVSGSAVTITDTTNGTQVGATLIRVNGAKATDGTVTTDGIAIGHHADVVTSVATATKETGNFITGLDNTKWDPKVNGIVSGRAATEDQLKVVDDKVNKGRVFTADTKDANNKPVEAMVGLGETLSIVGGAKMDALTDNNIGVELKAAETKDGVTIPTTMTVKLAKHVNMGDGSTTYTKDVTDKAGKKVGVRTGVMDGDSMKYTLYNVDAAGNIITDANKNKDVNVSTTVTSGGIVIAPKDRLSSKTVTLSHEGLNNGGNRITNVADGVAMDDAATVGQLKRSTTTIINHANTIGAHAAALAAMNPLSFDPMRKSQIMAGIGSYRGKQALALGVAHYTSENFMFNVGISMGENEHMMNAGMTYRFGGNTSMIPERYKGGPLSSVYVMQDEIAAFKEENARQKEQLKELPELKQEVAELRAMVQQLLAAQGK